MSTKIHFILIFLIFSTFSFGQNIEISHLKTDQQNTPLGFDNPIPEFSWILKSQERGVVQTAFEIWVSDDVKSPCLESKRRNVGMEFIVMVRNQHDETNRLEGSMDFGSTTAANQ